MDGKAVGFDRIDQMSESGDLRRACDLRAADVAEERRRRCCLPSRANACQIPSAFDRLALRADPHRNPESLADLAELTVDPLLFGISSGHRADKQRHRALF